MVWRIFRPAWQREIELLVTKELEYLGPEFGFGKPKYKREWWQTTIHFLDPSLAIEVDLDWYYPGVFFLVVALEEGRLPESGYVSKGRTCRIHLMQLLKDKKWIEPDEFNVFTEKRGKRIKKATYPKKPEDFKEDIRRYSALLKDKLPLILANRDTLFDEADKRRADLG